MPLYEFKCSSCEEVSEELISDREQRTSKCPVCGEISNKIMSIAGWDLKGGGVYRTGPPAPAPKPKRKYK